MIRASVTQALFLDFIEEWQIHRPTTIWFFDKLWYYIDTVLPDSTHEGKQSFCGVHRVSIPVLRRQMLVYLPIKDMTFLRTANGRFFLPTTFLFFFFCQVWPWFCNFRFFFLFVILLSTFPALSLLFLYKLFCIKKYNLYPHFHAYFVNFNFLFFNRHFLCLFPNTLHNQAGSKHSFLFLFFIFPSHLNVFFSVFLSFKIFFTFFFSWFLSNIFSIFSLINILTYLFWLHAFFNYFFL